jgi:hypothetical protein
VIQSLAGTNVLDEGALASLAVGPMVRFVVMMFLDIALSLKAGALDPASTRACQVVAQRDLSNKEGSPEIGTPFC